MNKIKEKLSEELPKVRVKEVKCLVFFPGDKCTAVLRDEKEDAFNLCVSSRSAYVRLTVEIFDGSDIERIISDVSRNVLHKPIKPIKK